MNAPAGVSADNSPAAMMGGALAIFVKTPGLSPVKTRLQAARGRAFAEHWHRLAAAATASVAGTAMAEGWLQAYWAVAEAEALAHPLWASLPCLPQGAGGLGERMAKVHGALVEGHGFGLLIGADAPQLGTAALIEAADWLRADAPRCVIGLAEDGGFWLFGANRVIPLAAWTSVRYSCRETGDDFRRAMSGHGHCLTVAALRDVDVEDDLAPVHGALRALPQPTADQQTLLQWLEHALPRGAGG